MKLIELNDYSILSDGQRAVIFLHAELIAEFNHGYLYVKTGVPYDCAWQTVLNITRIRPTKDLFECSLHLTGF